MAKNVVVQVLGGAKQVLDDVSTVKEVKAKLNLPEHTATINGEQQGSDYQLEDGDFVSLAQAVKGGV